ncbi:hypothetical protein BC941DRAFT_183996 [Chlamydoabsidia padenii]|nr:hypothetical protein BC941DRAFT_183996 [Chlamydoabsidia padenii]
MLHELHQPVELREKKKKSQWDVLKEPKKKTVQLHSLIAKAKCRIPGFKTLVKTKKKEVKNIMDEMNDITSTADPNKLVAQKIKCLEKRKIATENLEDINRNILDLYHQIDELNKQKASIYDTIHGRKQNRSPPTVNLLIEKGSCVGVDPGVKNMASAVSMDCGQAYSTLLLANKYLPLLQELENDHEKVKWLMKFHTMKINASNINCKSRSTFYRHQLQHKKDENKKEREDSDGGGTSIYALESSISEAAKLSIENKHNVGKHCKDDLVKFYHEFNWTKKQGGGQSRFTSKAYDTVSLQRA